MPLRTGPPWPVLLTIRELAAGGSERQLVEVARSLDRAQFEPHVGCLVKGWRSQALDDAGVPVMTIPVKSFRSLSIWRGMGVLHRYLRRHSIQLVHTFDWPTTSVCVPAARMARVPVVLSSQRGHRSLTPQPQRTIVRLTDRFVDGIVVNCEYMRQHLIHDERVRPSNIELCHNGVDTSLFRQRADRPEGPLVIGNVGVLREEKGIPLLIEAFQRFQKMRPDCLLRIVGDGPLRNRLESMRDALDLGRTVTLEPATADVAAKLREFDIFVLPSHSEAFSNSLMEAMATGLPVIASRVGGNPELVQDGTTGLLFPPGNACALSEALLRLAENAALRERLGQAAAASMRQQFTTEQSARRMGEIYLHRLSDQARSSIMRA